MTYSAIVRADRGGLGNQTVEMCAHVPPAKVLVVNPGGRRNRGEMDLPRYAHVDEVRVADGDVLDDHWYEWLAEGVDLVHATECGYSPRWVDIVRRAGARSACAINPELLVDSVGVDLALLPTSWEAARVNERRARIGMPDARYLPVPVNRKLLPERPHSGQLTTIYHPTCAAFHDRNGTLILLAALRHCRHRFRVLIRGEPQRVRGLGNCSLEWLPPVEDYWRSYPEEADVMVLPRRYAGLSLSMQEAASVGLPIVTLDLSPQREWLDPASLVACSPGRTVAMRGGNFAVWDADPRALARRLDDLAEHPDVLKRLRERSLSFARGLSWANWTDAYARVLGMR